MDSLITVIGNAVADENFRKEFLENPQKAIDDWGFRLTKGETEILETIITKEKADVLEKQFKSLRETLYSGPCRPKVCVMSIYPPPSRAELRKAIKIEREEAQKAEAA